MSRKKKTHGRGEIRALVAPDTLDIEARTVDLVWSTGARVMRGDYYEELSMDPTAVRMSRLLDGAPLLDSHDASSLSSIIGVVESASVADGRGVATVRFARDAHSDVVLAKISDGIIRGVSVGYMIHGIDTIMPGDDMYPDNVAERLPIYRVIDWEPYEISIVPVGADPGAGVRGIISVDLDDDEENKMSVKKKRAVDDSAQLESDVEDSVGDAVAVALADERSRVSSIRDAARSLGLDGDMVERAISSGQSVDEFRAAAIVEYGKKSSPLNPASGTMIEGGDDERDKWRSGAASWILHRCGQADLIRRAAAKTVGSRLQVSADALSVGDPAEFRGLSLLDLARASLERDGVNTRRMSRMDIAGAALASGQRGYGYNTTSDFPVFLENVMHKTLLANYAVTPDTWTQFCSIGSVSDFRPHIRIRRGSFARLNRVNEHGEFKNLQIPDGEKQSVSISTYGNMIALSRQAIVNDDIGAFVGLAEALGRAARRSIEADVYAALAENGGLGPELSDGLPVFDPAHANIGTGSVISVAGIEADRVLMAAQTDPSGNEILDLRPAVLLVPSGIGGQARVINGAEYDVDLQGATGRNKFQQPNVVRGLYSTIVDTARMTGTRRYSFADPSIAPTLEVDFLDGQQTPYLELQDGWTIDGVTWKVRLDYGVNAVDYRGCVTNEGVEAAS